MHDRRQDQPQVSTDPGWRAGEHFSRRAFLGAGAAVAAGMSLNLAEPASAAPPGRPRPPGEVPFGPVTVTDPGNGASYARAVRLGNSRTWLASYQQFGAAGFPIFRSTDDGHTWQHLSNVPSNGDVSGFWLQPSMYELPCAFAGLPRGTLLFAGNDLGDFTSTKIELYASRDRGLSWRHLSTVAQGGPPNPNNGGTPVWEPFLLLHRNRLGVYYSDQRDPKHGQKLAHQTTTDLRTWGPVVNDVADPDYDLRPGMTTIAQITPHLWILTYENGNDKTGNPYAVRYRLARDPELFDSAPDFVLHDQDGYIPSAAPTVSWSDSGGPAGTIVVTANSDQDFFVNRHFGDPRSWTRVSSPIPGGYSRQTIPLAGTGSRWKPGLVFVVTGPVYAVNGPIQAGVVRI